MRYLVISDIHANLEAYETVMAEAAPLKYDKVLILGDLVGYGADPNAICEKVRALKPEALIRGNHDKVGSGVESPEGFNAVARNAIRWTFENLTNENRDWLAELPAGPMIVDDLIEVSRAHIVSRLLVTTHVAESLARRAERVRLAHAGAYVFACEGVDVERHLLVHLGVLRVPTKDRQHAAKRG